MKASGPTGRETPAQGRGRRPTPWEKGHPHPGGLKGRETLHALSRLARTETLSDIVGHLKTSSNDGLPNRDPQTVSRPFRPHRVVNLSTQGVGLRPRPWAGVSRPVGPVGRFSDKLLSYFMTGPNFILIIKISHRKKVRLSLGQLCAARLHPTAPPDVEKSRGIGVQSIRFIE